MSRAIILAEATILSVVLVGCNRSKGDQSPPVAIQPQAIQTVQAAEKTQVDANTATCDGLFARGTEIDNGATYNNVSPTGLIHTIKYSSPDKEYDDLKDCWRRQRIGKNKPDIDYKGMGDFMAPVKLGMSRQEVAEALPAVSREEWAAGIPMWISERCVKPKPSESARYSLGCICSRPQLHGIPDLANADPDFVTLKFDGDGSDAKLLGWILISSLPVGTYKTTDEVIRWERENTELRELGPPDDANETEAHWYWFDEETKRAAAEMPKELESVSLRVERHGRAFVVTMFVDDNEHEDLQRADAAVRKTAE